MDLVSPSFGLIFWNIIIFLILILFLSKFAWKPIINIIETRDKNIKNSINKSILLNDKLKELEIKKKKILQKALDEKNNILKETKILQIKIQKEAKEKILLEKKKMIKDAKKIIDIERKKSFLLLKNKIIDISIEMSMKILSNKLKDENSHRKLIKELIKKIIH